MPNDSSKGLLKREAERLFLKVPESVANDLTALLCGETFLNHLRFALRLTFCSFF